jgi:biopolymer transport protein ExbD
MAVKIRKFRRPVQDMEMSSISDIVFLLLIYFMVVAVFQQDIGMPFVLPAAADNQDTTVKIKESNIASLTIDANNLILLDDAPLRINQIKLRIEQRLRENPKLDYNAAYCDVLETKEGSELYKLYSDAFAERPLSEFKDSLTPQQAELSEILKRNQGMI